MAWWRRFKVQVEKHVGADARALPASQSPDAKCEMLLVGTIRLSCLLALLATSPPSPPTKYHRVQSVLAPERTDPAHPIKPDATRLQSGWFCL